MDGCRYFFQTVGGSDFDRSAAATALAPTDTAVGGNLKRRDNDVNRHGATLRPVRDSLPARRPEFQFF